MMNKDIDNNIRHEGKGMQGNKKTKMSGRGKKSKRGILLFTGIIIAAAILLILYPEKRSSSIKASGNLFTDIILILPAVMILMGLFTVWVDNKTVVKFLGQASGVPGLAIALFLGMMPTGPLYIAFPVAAMLLKKGARVANIIIFLSSWACIKLPQELVELQFMGFKFMIIRLTATVIMVIIMGLIIERIEGLKEGNL